MDHYEVRKYAGWHHHMLTTMLAHFFLWHLKLRVGKKSPSSYRVAAANDIRGNTIQIKATASQKGRVGCGQPLCSGRLSRHFDILRLTTRGLER
jgi:hypothetical protein